MGEKLATSDVQVRNGRVIVTRWEFRPNEATGFHRHKHDYTVVPLTTGEFTIVNPDGSTSQFYMEEGKSYFRQQGVEHNVVNSSNYDMSFVEIEII